MKNKKMFWRIATVVLLVFLIFLLWPGRERASGYLASVGIVVPESSITAFEKGPFMLTGDEYLIAFRLPPAQIPALIKQIQTRERHEIGSYPRDFSSRVIRASYVAKFFAAVPKNATGATFDVIHDRGEKNEWTTDCSLAIDKSTGRVWFYGWETYN